MIIALDLRVGLSANTNNRDFMYLLLVFMDVIHFT